MEPLNVQLVKNVSQSYAFVGLALSEHYLILHAPDTKGEVPQHNYV